MCYRKFFSNSMPPLDLRSIFRNPIWSHSTWLLREDTTLLTFSHVKLELCHSHILDFHWELQNQKLRNLCLWSKGLRVDLLVSLACFHMVENFNWLTRFSQHCPLSKWAHSCSQKGSLHRSTNTKDTAYGEDMILLRKTHHFAAWEMVCRPKNEGGLGVINLEIQNKSLSMKKPAQVL